MDLVLKTSKHVYRVEEDEEGGLIIYREGQKLENTGLLIYNMGGVDKLLERCIEVEDFDTWLAERKEKHSQMLKRQMEVEMERELQWREEKRREFQELKSKFKVIPSTRENLRTVMAYLTTVNWGSWDLPSMTVGYRAHQYNCDGETAVTFQLNRPVDGKTKYQYGAPRGYLNKYHWI